MSTRGTVRVWHEDEGWGVIDTEETPGGCFAHSSQVDVPGYRSLRAGQSVELSHEVLDQDGCAFRATSVRPSGPTSRGRARLRAQQQAERGVHLAELVGGQAASAATQPLGVDGARLLHQHPRAAPADLDPGPEARGSCGGGRRSDSATTA